MYDLLQQGALSLQCALTVIGARSATVVDNLPRLEKARPLSPSLRAGRPGMIAGKLMAIIMIPWMSVKHRREVKNRFIRRYRYRALKAASENMWPSFAPIPSVNAPQAIWHIEHRDAA